LGRAFRITEKIMATQFELTSRQVSLVLAELLAEQEIYSRNARVNISADELDNIVGELELVGEEDGGVIPQPGISLVSKGPYTYMDDVDTKVEFVTNTGFTYLNTMPYPRIGLADSYARLNAEEHSKWSLHAQQNPARLSEAQDINTNLIYLRFFNPVEYQDNINHALPFTGTADSSTITGDMFAGHWVYKAGTTLTAGISDTDMTIPVADASLFSANQYVVIYDAPAGSFANAEQVKISAVDTNSNTLTVEPDPVLDVRGDQWSVNGRGFKSTAVAHASGSIIAQHVTVNVNDSTGTNWMYNLSTRCPLDASNKSAADTLVSWAQVYYNKLLSGTEIDITVHGFHFDVDKFWVPLNFYSDIDNDLAVDDGIDDSTGDHFWRDGVDLFYSKLRTAMPNFMIIGGGSHARGLDTINGVQMEGFPVSNESFTTTPEYEDINATLGNYSAHVRNHKAGPSLTMALSKAPTLYYPGMEPEFRRDPEQPAPTSNAPFRFSFGMALLDDGFYGQPNSGDYIDTGVWWDEYSVIVDPTSEKYSRPAALNSLDESEARANLGWLGQPINDRIRVYSSAAFDPINNLINNGGFETSLTGWSAVNTTLSRVADSPTAGGGWSLYSPGQTSFNRDFYDTRIVGPTVNLTAGTEYTIAFSIKSDYFRRILFDFGGYTQEVDIPARWSKRVINVIPEVTDDYALTFRVGNEDSAIWLDEVYVFEGSASIFQRDFDNGRVVVNATNQQQTIELGGNFRKIKGVQDPTHNDGLLVDSVTLDAYDAILLIRE